MMRSCVNPSCENFSSPPPPPRTGDGAQSTASSAADTRAAPHSRSLRAVTAAGAPDAERRRRTAPATRAVRRIRDPRLRPRNAPFSTRRAREALASFPARIRPPPLRRTYGFDQGHHTIGIHARVAAVERARGRGGRTSNPEIECNEVNRLRPVVPTTAFHCASVACIERARKTIRSDGDRRRRFRRPLQRGSGTGDTPREPRSRTMNRPARRVRPVES